MEICPKAEAAGEIEPVAGTDHNRFGRIVVKIILRPDNFRTAPEKSKA
jgi:hypothetical protein